MVDDRRLRVLFAPETFNLGETSRAVEVAREVRASGHETRFMGYSRRFAGYVREAGFTLEVLAPELSEEDADRLIAVDQGRALRHPFTESMVRQRVSSELALIDRWRPDVIVIGTTLTLLLSARAAGVPLAYVRPYAMSRSHLTRMPAFPLVTGSGALATGLNRTAGLLVRTLVTSLRWLPRSFRRVAAENGVRLPARTIAALDADLNLIASLFPADDHKVLLPGDVAVGPVYARQPGQLPDDIVALTGRTRHAVYVGLGSSAQRQLALDVLTAISTLDIEIVTSVGTYLTEGDRHALPRNVHVHDFLPAHRLTGLVDASVVHGGEGTVQTACAIGVPFAGIGLQPEQRLNIDECVRYGSATRFTTRDVHRGKLPGIVERLLRDARMRDAALRLQDAARPIGAATSAQAVIDLGRRGRRAQP